MKKPETVRSFYAIKVGSSGYLSVDPGTGYDLDSNPWGDIERFYLGSYHNNFKELADAAFKFWNKAKADSYFTEKLRRCSSLPVELVEVKLTVESVVRFENTESGDFYTELFLENYN